MVLLGTIVPSNTLFSQKNRFSIQTGIFHQFFDGTPIINTEHMITNTTWKIPQDILGGYLSDSWGLQYKRMITSKSAISCEYSLFMGTYLPPFATWVGGPRMYGRRLNKVNLTYSRKLTLNEHLDFVYGAGLNYQWGFEFYYLVSPPHPNDLFGKYFFRGYRKDFALNTRLGIDYKPIKYLTLFTYIDFLGSVYLKSENIDGIDTYDFFNRNFNITKFPSRYDLSLNFGIGFNF